MNFHQARLKALADGLPNAACDGLLVSHPLHQHYLLGHVIGSAYLAVTRAGSTLIRRGPSTRPDGWALPVEVVEAAGEEEAAAKLSKHLARCGVRTLGVEGNHVTLRQAADLGDRLAGVVLRPAEEVEGLRAIKDPGEVEAVRAAADVAARAWQMTRVMLAADDTEDELEVAVAGYARRAGGRLTVPRPVALGLNTGGSKIDDSPTLGQVGKFTFDATVAATYHSRLVRSEASPFPAEPSRRSRAERVGRKFEALHAAATAVQAAAAVRLGDGVPVADVFGAARQAAARAGCEDALSPWLGHGIGLEGVEGPSLSADSQSILRAGMVVHVAPRIVYPEWGGVSVGDDFVVRHGSATRLSRA